MKSYSRNQLFRYRYRPQSEYQTDTLAACYELDLSWIGGSFGPEMASAEAMFDHWVSIVRDRYPDGRIPICWFIRPEHSKIEFMPGQGFDEDFTTFYTTPRLPDGDVIEWDRLPVQDQNWTRRGWVNSGFIQHATGWKPKLLQPYISLDYLDYLAWRKANRQALVGP